MSHHDESFVETVPVAVLLEINRLCVEFEKAWRDGKLLRVEDFSARMTGDAQVAAIRELIVQEYIEGQDLANYLNTQNSGLPAEQAVGLLISIAEALSFAHQKGFVHRDLKPANILLDAQLRPRVAEFGLAVHETIQRRRRGDRSGTPAYMSPEQVRGETHRLDAATSGASELSCTNCSRYDSVSFCRWLSQQSGLPESDQSYADPESFVVEQQKKIACRFSPTRVASECRGSYHALSKEGVEKANAGKHDAYQQRNVTGL